MTHRRLADAGTDVSPAARSSRSAIGRTITVVVEAGACIFGVFVGREIAHQGSLGGFGGSMNALFLGFLLILSAGAVGLVGLIALAFRLGHASQAVSTIFVSAGLILLGAVGGGGTAGFTGGIYHEPAVLHTEGETQIELRPNALMFVAQDHGRARCESVPDGRDVAVVTGLELGELGSGTLRATLPLKAETRVGARAEFFIDGGDLAEGVNQPFWGGPVQITELGGGGLSGRLTFENLERVDTHLPDAWPATISGTVRWACEPW